ncbi:MAG: biotin--[acetyl-CoA-carboxylase] ligase [Planctomycetes bacterium]|nr:biotin--[acetyl-CoA-carboxylase] ligase [Planctomycetota bacterium]
MNDRSAHQLSENDISTGLITRRVGRRIIVLPKVDSTNTHALQTLAPRDGPAADGTVVFAERQTAGRGRLGRTWHSPAGASLMCTTLLREPENAARAAFWMMAGALAVVKAIESATDVSPQIRWPNDIYVGPRKLAGILVEASVIARDSMHCGTAVSAVNNGEIAAPQSASTYGISSAWLAIGIGINCLQQPAHFPDEIRAGSTSLDIESRGPIDRIALARALLTQLDAVFANPAAISEDDLAAEWSAHSADIGQRVTLVHGREQATGVILDIHPREGLLLQPDAGPPRHFDPATTSRSS